MYIRADGQLATLYTDSQRRGRLIKFVHKFEMRTFGNESRGKFSCIFIDFNPMSPMIVMIDYNLCILID